MNYVKIHDQIIQRALDRDEVGDEVHHIIPKCMGGDNDSDNLVRLTLKEHFIIHRLLAKIFPKHAGLSFAVWIMGGRSRAYVKPNRRLISAYHYDRLAVNKGFLNDQECRNIIWDLAFEDDLSSKQISEFTGYPLGFIQRTIRRHAMLTDSQDLLSQRKYKQKSTIFKNTRSLFDLSQESNRLEKIKNTKNTPAYRSKMSRMRRGSNNPNSKPVVVNGTLFGSVAEAAELLGIPHYTIRHRVKSINFTNYTKG